MFFLCIINFINYYEYLVYKDTVKASGGYGIFTPLEFGKENIILKKKFTETKKYLPPWIKK